MTDEQVLHRLTEDGRRLVGEQFLKGEITITAEDIAEYVEPIPGKPTADLASLDTAVDTVLSEYSEFETAMDSALARGVHQCLDITRRTAGDLDEATRRFNHALTNIQLEGLSQREAEELVQRIISEVKSQ